MMDHHKGFRFLMEAPGVLPWLSFLRERGLADAGKLSAITRDVMVIKTRESPETPIYLRSLSAVGAVISGFLLLYLLYLFGLFSLSKMNLSINGFIFIGLSALLQSRGQRKASLSRDFYIQLALTLLQVGKFALVAGLSQIVHDTFGLGWGWTVSIILGLVMVLSFLAFPRRSNASSQALPSSFPCGFVCWWNGLIGRNCSASTFCSLPIYWHWPRFCIGPKYATGQPVFMMPF